MELWWSEEQIASLMRGLEANETASVIALRVERETGRCISRSAVLGKIHRLKRQGAIPPHILAAMALKDPPKPPKPKHRTPKPASPHKPKLKLITPKKRSLFVKAIFSLPEPPPGEEHRKSIWQLTSTSCRFPMSGSGAETLYCGAPIEDKGDRRLYCAHHRKVCYVGRWQHKKGRNNGRARHGKQSLAAG